MLGSGKFSVNLLLKVPERNYIVLPGRALIGPGTPNKLRGGENAPFKASAAYLSFPANTLVSYSRRIFPSSWYFSKSPTRALIIS